MFGFAIFLVIVCCLIYIQKETGTIKPIIQLIGQFLSGCFQLAGTFIEALLKLLKWLILGIPKLLKLIFLNLHYIIPSFVLSLYLFIAFKLGKDFAWITSFKVFLKMSTFAITNNPIAFMFFWGFVLLAIIGLLAEVKEKFKSK